MPSPALSGPTLVIGSAGALGREIYQQLADAGLPVVGVGRGELDASEPLEGLAALVEKAAAARVINCLSMTGLDKCFREPAKAFEANGLLPLKLAALSRTTSLPIVQFSTENVFSCNVSGLMYMEDCATGPNTVYGLSKLVGEATDLRVHAPFHVIRLPMLYGPSNGRQIVAKLVREMLRGKTVSVSSDVFTTPTYSPDVANFVVDWVKGTRKLSAVTHLTSGHKISLHALIQIIAEELGVPGNLQSTLSTRFPSLEAKPLHGGLRSAIVDHLP